MTPHRIAPLLLGLLALIAPRADGHFLFIKVTPMAEAGRSAEVYFSEQAEAGDPRLIAKLIRTKLWVQAKPGEFTPVDLKRGPDRLRAVLPASGGLGVVGVCEYGVLARPNQKPFLLRYYPKAVDGTLAEINALRPIGDRAAFEIGATVDEKGIGLVALRDGKPIPKATFTTVDASLANETITADDAGHASWSPKSEGVYTIYTNATLPTSGTLDGQPYAEIREFATLSFRWPASRSGADPEAVALFEKAVADRAQWADFAGFTADLSGDFDGRPFSGSVDVDREGKVTVKTDDRVSKSWVSDQIHSIVLHRRADSGTEATPVLRFADDRDDHPIGRLLLFEGGRFASSYRIKDGRITVVNRHVGPMNMTITTLGQRANAEGKSLPTSYVVQYWDAKSGDLTRVETVQDGWVRVGSLDLPADHVVTSAADGGLSTRGFTLTNHKIRPAKP